MTRSDRVRVKRILDRYRRLILLGKVRLPLDVARRLVGPDCAYHLYFRHAGTVPSGSERGRARRRARRHTPQGRGGKERT